MSDASIPAGPESGFTLVEVLVALAVLALGLGFVFKALSGDFEWSARSRDEEAALLLAEGTLARVGHDIPLRDGTATGRAENGMTWHVTISPYAETGLSAPGLLAGHRVRVAIDWSTSHYNREVKLDSLRLGRRGQHQ